MKSFSAVYNQSKADVLGKRKAEFDRQKEAIVTVLKEQYDITGKISDLPAKQKEAMMTRLLEYWSPKEGINHNGINLLKENIIILTPNSTRDDVKAYITKMTKKNIGAMTEAWRMNQIDIIVSTFKDDIQPKIKKQISESAIRNIVWKLIEGRIKNGIRA